MRLLTLRSYCIVSLVCTVLFASLAAGIRATTLDQVLNEKGKWKDPTNWTGGVIPTNAEIVVGKKVTLDLGDAYSVNTLKINGNGIEGAGSLSLIGSGSTWQSGDLLGVGGVGELIIASGANLEIKGGSKSLLAWALINHGTINWISGDITTGDGALITNSGTGIFNTTTNGQLLFNNDDPRTVFTNEGTFTKSASTGTTEIQATFNNTTGTVNVSTGTLLLSGGGTNSDTFNTSSGATTQFGVSGYTLADGSNLNGDGTYSITSGTVTVNGSVTASNMAVQGGNLDAAGTLAASNLALSSGNVGGTGTVTLSGTASTWSGGSMSGSGTTDVLAGGTLSINSGNPTLNGRSLNNAGTVSHSPPNYLILGGSGTLTNKLGGLWKLENNTAFTGGTFTFDNQSGATLRKTTTTGTLTFNIPLTNAGTLDVLGGTFVIGGGGSATGGFTLAADSTLKFNSDYTLGPGSTFSSTGSLWLSSGTLTLARGSDFAPPIDLLISGGTLTGADTFKIASDTTTTWTDGAMTGSGTTDVLPGGTLSINSGNPILNGRSLNNAGLVEHLPANYLILSGSGTLKNQLGGVWDFQSNTSFTGGSFTFDNQAGAVLLKSSGTGTATFSLPITNAGTIKISSGALRFTNTFTQTAGTIALLDGSIVQFDSDLNLAAGALVGSGTVVGDVTSHSLVSPGTVTPGQLHIEGSLTLMSTSALLFNLGGNTPATGFDLLSISGSATLDGELQLTFVDGFESFVQPTDTFTIATAASLSGAFANVLETGLRLNTIDGLGSFQVNFGAGSAFPGLANSVVLSNFVAVPEPSTYAMLGLGALGVFWSVRRRRR